MFLTKADHPLHMKIVKVVPPLAPKKYKKSNKYKLAEQARKRNYNTTAATELVCCRCCIDLPD